MTLQEEKDLRWELFSAYTNLLNQETAKAKAILENQIDQLDQRNNCPECGQFVGMVELAAFGGLCENCLIDEEN